MIFIFAALAGIAGAAAGWFVTAAVTAAIAIALGVSNFEGAIGYLAAWGIGPFGGLAGLILGVTLVLRFGGGYRTFTAIGGRGLAVIAGIAALAVAGIAIRLATVEHFSGANPTLHFEIRLPAKVAVPERRTIDFEMQAGSQRSGGFFDDAWLRRDGGRPVLSGYVPLYTRVSRRLLVVSLPDKSKLLFDIRLPATPKASERYGKWRRVDFIDDGKTDSQPRRAGAGEDYEIRLRVPDWTKPYVQPAK